MKFVPHEYQAYCIEYIKTHPVAALFLDMGLGKTVITLTAIRDLMLDSFDVKKVLVIAPLRVARDTWPAELKKWEHLQDLDISVVIGTSKERAAALSRETMIYVINRENVQWLVDFYHFSGRSWDFDMIVIDELSSFKNVNGKRFKALRKVRPLSKRVVGLTGTPASNGYLDLWGEIGLLDMGQRLGRFISRYRDCYFKPGARNPQTGVVFNYVLRDNAADAIFEKIADITISMKAKDYLHMPDCIYTSHEVVMNPEERKLYDTMERDCLLHLVDADIDAVSAAALSNKLLQMANGAVYDEDKVSRIIHNRKLDMLEDLIEAANGQNVLVAYWYQHDVTRIMNSLTAAGYKPKALKSSKDIDDWNEGRIQVGLIHPMSAGHGLNIQYGGHILIWFGITWSLELYQQANARLWRQGQKEVVTIHHIVAKDTIDEDVYDALENKNTTQQRLMEAVRARIGKVR